MDLQSFIGVLRNRWLAPVLTTAVALAAGVVGIVLSTPQYKSRVQFFVSVPPDRSDPQAAYAGAQFTQQRVLSYASIVTSPAVLGPVVKDLALHEDPRELAKHVDAHVPVNTVLINVGVEDPSRKRARLVAAGIARNFVRVIAALEKPPGGAASAVHVSVSRPASIPLKPVSPKKKLILAVSLAAGCLIGILLALILEALDVSVRRVEDIELDEEVVPLGSVPRQANIRSAPLAEILAPMSPVAEAARHLRTGLQFLNIDRSARLLLITSPQPKEGKSALSMVLAGVMAQSGTKVILVESDLRVPSVSDRLRLPSMPGLTDVLVGRASLDAALREVDIGAKSLSILPCGTIPPYPSELLASDRMTELTAELEARADVVLFDGPPLLPVTDGTVLARLVESVILTVRHGKTRKDEAREAIRRLDGVGARLLGVVVGFVPPKSTPGTYYGYGSLSRADARSADASVA